MLARTLNAAADTAESVAQALKDHPTQPDVVADTVWAHMWTDRRQRQVRPLPPFIRSLTRCLASLQQTAMGSSLAIDFKQTTRTEACDVFGRRIVFGLADGGVALDTFCVCVCVCARARACDCVCVAVGRLFRVEGGVSRGVYTWGRGASRGGKPWGRWVSRGG